MSAGIYVHIPFCKSRCSYCDFATDVYRDSGAVQTYVDALCREILGFGSEAVQIDTIYFGGGTPSLLSSEQLEQILACVRKTFEVDENSELTLEMNPARVTPESLAGYRRLGINRASIGIQTFNDLDLKLLARGHDAGDAVRTFEMLRQAGFRNISIDLIAGLPGQELSDWKTNLDAALNLDAEHLSLYLLEIHSGTPLAEQLRSGRRPEPDPELAAEMFEYMIDRLVAAGYDHYEISNFAKKGFASRHNSKYWTLDPVFGFGVSAHSFDGCQRYANERDTAKYVQEISQIGSAESMREDIDRCSEHCFLGLRMTDGLDLDSFEAIFGYPLGQKYGTEIEQLQENELVEVSGGRLRLTRKGMLFSNEVFAEFV